jgi:hypothetical protein
MTEQRAWRKHLFITEPREGTVGNAVISLGKDQRLQTLCQVTMINYNNLRPYP